MPTVVIPDKICSHCGGTKWKKVSRGKGVTRLKCVIIEKDRLSKSRKTEVGKAREKRSVDKRKEQRAVIRSLKPPKPIKPPKVTWSPKYTEELLTKVCIQCEVEKHGKNFIKYKNNGISYYAKCSSCREKLRPKRKHLRPQNAARNKKYRELNEETLKEKSKLKEQNDRLMITDNYVRRTINRSKFLKLKRVDIPQELIELKRKQLKLNRDVQQHKKQINSTNSTNSTNTSTNCTYSD